jgi:hypothetical protein
MRTNNVKTATTNVNGAIFTLDVLFPARTGLGGTVEVAMDCLSWCVCAAHKSGWLLRFPTLRKSAKDGAPSIAVRKEELKGGAPGSRLLPDWI